MNLFYSLLIFQFILSNTVSNDSIKSAKELDQKVINNQIGKIKSNYYSDKSQIEEKYKLRIKELKLLKKKELKNLRKDYKKKINKIRKKYPELPEIQLDSKVIPKKIQPSKKDSD